MTHIKYQSYFRSIEYVPGYIMTSVLHQEIIEYLFLEGCMKIIQQYYQATQIF